MGGSPNTYPFLLVDDEQQVLFSTSVLLNSAFCNGCITLDDSSKVLPLLSREAVAAVVLDLSMPGMGGQEVLRQITYKHPHIPVIVMTASNTVEIAVQCMHAGAFDYLVKPVNVERLVKSVTRALEVSSLRGEVNSLKHHLLTGKLQQESAFAPIITRSSKMRALFQYLESIGKSQQPLLLSGETGVGKELFARAAHELSGCSGPFVALNVAGLDDLMFSDTLFGHRKGAFTGADQAREGFVSRAASGTLFLDEIGDLNPSNQIKLLRLLQEREYYPLGSDVAVQNKARFVVATNRDLQQMVSDGLFRNDLYYRLTVHHCHIYPLRERLEDIPLLLEHFIAMAAQTLKKAQPSFSNELLVFLSAHSFPGNVRELQAMVHEAVAQNDTQVLTSAFFRKRLGGSGIRTTGAISSLSSASKPESITLEFSTFPPLKEVEERLVSQALAIAKGNQSMAASLLGLTRQAFNNRIMRKKNKS